DDAVGPDGVAAQALVADQYGGDAGGGDVVDGVGRWVGDVGVAPGIDREVVDGVAATGRVQARGIQVDTAFQAAGAQVVDRYAGLLVGGGFRRALAVADVGVRDEQPVADGIDVQSEGGHAGRDTEQV